MEILEMKNTISEIKKFTGQTSQPNGHDKGEYVNLKIDQQTVLKVKEQRK